MSMKETTLRNELYNHLEKVLGIPVDMAKARHSQDRKKAGFDLYRFENVPFEGALTFCSAGMSENPLKQADGSLVRNEILFTTYPPFLNDELYNLLFAAGNMFLEEQRAVTLGQLMMLEEPIVKGSAMEALFFYSPVYFPDEMYLYDMTDPPVVFAWAIPVTQKEAEFIEENGHEAFSDLLNDEDPDLADLLRESVV